GPAVDVVGLRGQQLLQDVRGAVGLERPDFHLSEALAAELRLAAERLLRDQRVRPDRAGVDLVVDQVRQLQHVDVADGDLLLEGLARHAVDEGDLALHEHVRPQRVALLLAAVRLAEQLLDLPLRGAVEGRRSPCRAPPSPPRPGPRPTPAAPRARPRPPPPPRGSAPRLWPTFMRGGT